MKRDVMYPAWFSFSWLILISCGGENVITGDGVEDSEHERDTITDVENDASEDGGEIMEDALVGCDSPIESWHRRVTHIDSSIGNIARVRENDETWIIASSSGMLGGELWLYRIAISEGVPSATPIAVDTSGLVLVSPASAARLGNLIVVLNPPHETQAAQAILFNTDGEVVRRGPLDFVPSDWFASIGDSAMAMSEDRIAVAISDGSGNILVEILDYQLDSVNGLRLERHSIARVRPSGSAFLLATINALSEALEIYELTDSGIGAPIFTKPVNRTLEMAWAGEKLVLTDPDRKLIIVIGPDGSEQTAAFPPEAEDWGLGMLTAAQSPYGIALGADTHNTAFVGLLRPDGSMTWQAAPEQGVFSLVHADEQNVGVYYVATFSEYGRSLTYLGFYCNPDA